jgi:DMSO reductase family type II enzyme molybdopterin subunit
MNKLTLELAGLESGNGPLPEVADYDAGSFRTAPWEWDAVARVTCRTNCSSQSGCQFNAYAKDGLVLRQELVGDLPAINDPEVPDPNPKGCQKGVVYPHRIYDPSRLKYPLKRAGARGEGRWQRISWDQALTEISDTMLDVLTTDGPEAIAYGAGSQGPMSAVDGMSYVSLTNALDVPFNTGNAEVGDERPGTALSFGKIVFGASPDNFHYADVILFWGGNPAYTTVSYYQYYSAARYNGTKIICISPDYSPSAIHADRWVPVNIGTDAALALSMAEVIVREKLYDTAFVREQTDLPFLVRADTRKLLREKDLKRGGKEEVFYLWDEAAGGLVEAPRKSLALGDIVPALEGEYTVETLSGRVKVRPVFDLVRDHLRQYTPEAAASITGVAPSVVEEVAREIARAKGVMYASHLNWGKMYHGDLIERAIILVTVLCGHVGKKGACHWGQGTLAPDFGVGAMEQRGDQVLVAAAAGDPRYAGWREDGYTDEMIAYEYTRDAFARGSIVASSIFYYIHGGLLELSDKHLSWDPHLSKKPGDYLREAFDKGWYTVVPKPGKDPKVMFGIGGDFLRRVRASQTVIDTLLPKLRLLVTADVRMTATGMYSDYVLPVCGWYEKYGLRLLGSTMNPYQHIINQTMEPLYESKDEWAIFCLLARKLDERAAARGLASFTDRSGKERKLGGLYDKVTVNGLYTEDDLESVVRDTFLNSSNLERMDWEEFKERGHAAFVREGKSSRSIGHSTDVRKGEPVIPLKWHVEGKQPYPTTSRRIQLYVDHDWYLELGEELPAQKEDPKAGGDYPLRMTSGHTRWSVHSTHQDDALLLQLQRGEPLMYVSQADADARGIRDGDTVEASNDVASFKVQAAVSPAVRPGQVIVYHGWINFQFPGFKHFKSTAPSPFNPVECAGGMYHLRPVSTALYPGLSDRETRLEIRRVN